MVREKRCGKTKVELWPTVCFDIVSGEYVGKSQPSHFPKNRGGLEERAQKKMLVSKNRFWKKKGCCSQEKEVVRE